MRSMRDKQEGSLTQSFIHGAFVPFHSNLIHTIGNLGTVMKTQVQVRIRLTRLQIQGLMAL